MHFLVTESEAFCNRPETKQGEYAYKEKYPENEEIKIFYNSYRSEMSPVYYHAISQADGWQPDLILKRRLFMAENDGLGILKPFVCSRL